MRAMTYQGAHKVQVDTVPDPIIEQPDDIILRVTATAILGAVTTVGINALATGSSRSTQMVADEVVAFVLGGVAS